MTPVLVAASTAELEAARMIVHVAGQAPGRLVAAWSPPSKDPVEPGFPFVLAALCLELDQELVRRGARFAPCVPCNHLVATRRPGPSADSQPPVLLPASSVP